MLIRRSPDIRSSEITPEAVYRSRRDFIREAVGLTALGLGGGGGWRRGRRVLGRGLRTCSIRPRALVLRVATHILVLLVFLGLSHARDRHRHGYGQSAKHELLGHARYQSNRHAANAHKVLRSCALLLEPIGSSGPVGLLRLGGAARSGA